MDLYPIETEVDMKVNCHVHFSHFVHLDNVGCTVTVSQVET